MHTCVHTHCREVTMGILRQNMKVQETEPVHRYTSQGVQVPGFESSSSFQLLCNLEQVP